MAAKYSSNRLRLLYRAPWVLAIFCIATAEAVALHLRHGTRVDGARWVQRQSRRLLRAAGFRFSSAGTPPPVEAGLLVCNHVSYIDILVTAASVPSVFISKKEVAAFFWLGWLARIAGTIFIDRSKSSQDAAEEEGKALDDGAIVAFYPEGTTSTGARLRRFHAALFAPAVQRGVPVATASIRYALAGGSPEDEIAFVDDMQMVPHIVHLLSLSGAEAHLQFGERFATRASDDYAEARAVANRAQRAVAAMLGVTPEREAEPLPA